MPAVSVTDSYDALLTTTAPFRAKQMWDNLVGQITLLDLIDADATKNVATTGHRVEVPLLYGSNSTVGRRGDYDTVDLTKQDGITMAFVPWKDLSGSVVISDREKAMNSGRERILSLLESKMLQLEDSMKNQLNTDLFSAGSSTNQVYGLQYWLRTSTATVASIDDSTNTWWQNKSTTSIGSFASNGRDKLRTGYNNASRGAGKDQPSHGITTQSVFEFLEKTTEPAERYDIASGGDNPTLKIGTERLKFKGASVTWDADCPSGTFYFLNVRSKQIQWNALKGHDFDMTPFVRPADQRVTASI